MFFLIAKKSANINFMKIIYFGSTEDSLYTLDILLDKKFEILDIFTKKSKSSGRGLKKKSNPIEIYAFENNISVKTPSTLRNDEDLINYFISTNVDIFVVSSYGLFIPKEILNVPKYGAINIHPSLLPKLRGPSPIASAILNGELATGVTIMQLDENMDTGPILEQSNEILIDIDDNASTLQKKLFRLGSNMLPGILNNILQNKQKAIVQNDDDASVTKMIKKNDGRIDWNINDIEIMRKVRAYDTWPGTFTFWKDIRIKIIDIKITETLSTFNPGYVFFLEKKIFINTKNKLIEITKIQFENKKIMNSIDVINGYPELNRSYLN